MKKARPCGCEVQEFGGTDDNRSACADWCHDYLEANAGTLAMRRRSLHDSPRLRLRLRASPHIRSSATDDADSVLPCLMEHFSLL